MIDGALIKTKNAAAVLLLKMAVFVAAENVVLELHQTPEDQGRLVVEIQN